MSNIEIVRKNLGPVTAYKYAVQQGYTGTEQEFAALMASYATVAEEAESARDDAIDAKTAAEEAQAAAEAAAQTLVIDSTLTQSGQAADAKATGDIKERVNSVEKKSEVIYDAQSRIEEVGTSSMYTKKAISFEISFPFVQDGTGNPSMSNIREITVYPDAIPVTVDGTQYTIQLDFEGSIADAIVDLIESTVTIYRFTKIFDGTENIIAAGQNSQNFVYNFGSAYMLRDSSSGSCSHFRWGSYKYNYAGSDIYATTGTGDNYDRFCFMTAPGVYTVDTFKEFLAEQYANETPVIVSGILKDPIVIPVQLPFDIEDGIELSVGVGELVSTKIQPVVDVVHDAVSWSGIDEYLHSKITLHMTHAGNGTYKTYLSRNAIISPVCFDFPITVEAENGYKVAIQYYDGFEVGQDHLINAGPWTNYEIIPAGSYWCGIFAESDDKETSVETNTHFLFKADANFTDVYSRLMPLAEKAAAMSDGNYIDAGFKKSPVYVERIGAVKYLQSWCMYNGHYYSTDGSHICEQDESFAEVRTVDLSVGHGNAFQMGNDNLAYISGWDDQKIYVVDMDTLTLDSTINLPTTGYTTCAVDEMRNLIYIFQRDTYPLTEENYNFIIYNYLTQQIVSTRKTSVKFSAMQACDMLDDRIIVLSGMGTSYPDYYRIFDTAGNVVGEYTFPAFAKYEPEGVYIDRNTKDIYMGLIGSTIYKIS